MEDLSYVTRVHRIFVISFRLAIKMNENFAALLIVNDLDEVSPKLVNFG